MAKIARKYLAHYINTAYGDGEPIYEQLGKDLESYTAEMSAQVETKRNILGQSSILISGYEKKASVDTYYAEEETGLFLRLQNIIDGGMVLEDLKTDVVEVKLWNGDTETVYPAEREEVYIEVVSYGGDTTGYQIPFTLHYTGNREKGTFDVKTKTFTAG